MTRNLLGFAQGGAYEVAPVYINEVIAEVNQIFKANRRDIVIHESFTAAHPVVETDVVQMQHVLMNLYTNASEAMPEGGDLTIRTEVLVLDADEAEPYRVDPGRYVSVSVTDTGCGMDEAVMQKIFDPFYTTKKPGAGTGLGLSSVYGIVRNHGGFVSVDSAEGEGTSILFFLPVSDKTVAARETASSRETVKGSETILVVDDEEMVVRACQRVLKHLNYKVIPARSGEEAVEIYKDQRGQIDLVILDILMPEMGGGDTYDALKTVDPEVKVLLSSGFSLDSQAKEILARGCRGFIQKPYDLEEISRKIREILGNTL